MVGNLEVISVHMSMEFTHFPGRWIFQAYISKIVCNLEDITMLNFKRVQIILYGIVSYCFPDRGVDCIVGKADLTYLLTERSVLWFPKALHIHHFLLGHTNDNFRTRRRSERHSSNK